MGRFSIHRVWARQVLDSRGNPTLEAEVVLEEGTRSRAMVPSGASTGVNEALELRDGNKARYGGKEVGKAVQNVQKRIAPCLQGQNALDQQEIDRLLRELDGTENKSNLGANAMLGVSLAVARVAAAALGIPLYRYLGGTGSALLPVPFANVLNGGAHSDAPLDFQEFMIVPRGAPTFSEAIRFGAETFHALRVLLRERNLGTGLGDEGGFAPNLSSADEALELLCTAVERAGYTPGKEIFFAMDPAASEFFDQSSEAYVFRKSDQRRMPAVHLVEYYKELCGRFPLISIEDGAAENDWEGWRLLTRELGASVQLVGDDVFVTNPEFLRKGIAQGVANSILIKPNQIGTLSETLETVDLAKRSGYGVMLSHRSGETEDPFLAHLAVACNAGQIKTGSFARSDRIAKYNELLRIEEDLGKNGRYGHW
ncbi:phosphopyruvate hydratase [Methylacidimicrobium tartarophylax]|uniref:Enolase n=1 Tax=Methylacidimicrobium tartarophylax TaxID=1041768 RepID=A0A5E6MF86_9BACT|nr:phosphopyruvate hydratase [Methylacidimicrobium tartarophylax]VVM04728.1 enolase [Methylacidimicrobium tartarophylax]